MSSAYNQKKASVSSRSSRKPNQEKALPDVAGRSLLQIRIPGKLLKTIRLRAQERGLAVSQWANVAIEEAANRQFIEGWAVDSEATDNLSRTALYAERREAQPNIRLYPHFISADSLIAEVFVPGDAPMTWTGPVTAAEARDHSPFASENPEDGVLILPHSGFWRPMQFIELTDEMKRTRALAVFAYRGRYPEGA